MKTEENLTLEQLYEKLLKESDLRILNNDELYILRYFNSVKSLESGVTEIPKSITTSDEFIKWLSR